MTKKGSQDEYRVGYAHPPKESQFKKGQSGNPSGRPKRAAPTINEAIIAQLSRQVRVTIDGKITKVTGAEALALAICKNAAKGNGAALRMLINAYAEEKAASKFPQFGFIEHIYVSPDPNKNLPAGELPISPPDPQRR